MTKPGPSVTSGADTQPGSDSLFPSGFGGGSLVRAGGVGTGEIADGSVAAADLNLPSVAAAIAARSELTGTYAARRTPDLLGFDAALANRATAPCDILVVADSIGEGTGGAVTTRWVAQLQNILRQHYPVLNVSGGQGYTTAYYSGFSSGSAGAPTEGGTVS